MEPILWTEAEPRRLKRDLDDVAAFAPGIEYQTPGRVESGFHHGAWVGVLPIWPFDRPQPEGLDRLVGSTGLAMMVLYPAAYPMIAPIIYPVDPEPSLSERTRSAWHVAPNGSLCLLQSVGGWQPETSLTELLAKAAGWRIEYALMKVGAIDCMTVNGIVSDPLLDELITATEEMADSAGIESPDDN
ncbi:hypothetical protein K3N28_05660 [Glycomyces sp. TRM65418]|uniref:hypothetical protein n=1 Tax=Glycomyces sp. TRM65418 TaxID=2867006 RepID=UPI001CE63A36|nr:hypothetical protein [Glycomyces sp. TRM65418]MCC3762554.1 hypothetical protein [Glycomyces sp. TRM65418]QZD56593.1 hypothetical protein K3N28_05620 [Glycomyces sp. TRM65418]